MKHLILIAALGLAACAGSAETRAINALAAACDGYATVLSALADHKADLSASQIGMVDSANEAVDPLCQPDSIVDPTKAVGIVRDGIDILNAIKGAF